MQSNTPNQDMDNLRRLGFSPYFSFDAAPKQSPEEQEPLLSDSELADDGVCLPTSMSASGLSATNSHDKLPVYATIHEIRHDILEHIDDPYSAEQLRSPHMNKLILRPMVDRWYERKDLSVVYCLLVNRVEFLREQSTQVHQHSVSGTRATLCEILASRILRRFDEDNPGPMGLLLLANVLVADYSPFQNAPEDIIREYSNVGHWTTQNRGGHERKLTSLEIAIISNSKVFLSSAPSQKVVEAIYKGRVIYTPTSFLDFLPDHYKRRPITLYDPRTRPLLNQYRLIVPRTRNALELIAFVILLVLYVLVMDNRDPTKLGKIELVFFVYAWGWCLDQFASMFEHGWTVYTQNLWSFLDVVFIIVYTVYFCLRMRAYGTGSDSLGELSFHVLAAGAPVLIPRLAFNLLSENMLFVSLRAMMVNFTVLTGLAVWCFAGFLLALNWMGSGAYTPITIARWMFYVWFGLDGTGVQRSGEFHWFLGPVLMVTFAFLGNTLFLTILVSMLSHTFSNIVSNATAEIQFRRAVLTFECVKGDAIFAFFPPFNILALFLLLPLKLVLSPRWFHKVVVTAVRVLNLPLLLAIGLWERKLLWASERHRREGTRPKQSKWAWDMGNLAVHGDLQSVFESTSNHHDEDADHNEDNDVVLEGEEGTGESGPGNGRGSENGRDSPDANRRPTLARRTTKRKDSMAMAGFSEVTEHLHTVLQDYGGVAGNKERLENMDAGLQRMEEQMGKMWELMSAKLDSTKLENGQKK